MIRTLARMDFAEFGVGLLRPPSTDDLNEPSSATPNSSGFSSFLLPKLSLSRSASQQTDEPPASLQDLSSGNVPANHQGLSISPGGTSFSESRWMSSLGMGGLARSKSRDLRNGAPITLLGSGVVPQDQNGGILIKCVQVVLAGVTSSS